MVVLYIVRVFGEIIRLYYLVWLSPKRGHKAKRIFDAYAFTISKRKLHKEYSGFSKLPHSGNNLFWRCHFQRQMPCCYA